MQLIANHFDPDFAPRHYNDPCGLIIKYKIDCDVYSLSWCLMLILIVKSFVKDKDVLRGSKVIVTENNYSPRLKM